MSVVVADELDREEIQHVGPLTLVEPEEAEERLTEPELMRLAVEGSQVVGRCRLCPHYTFRGAFSDAREAFQRHASVWH